MLITNRRALLGGLALAPAAAAFPALAWDVSADQANAALDAEFNRHAPPAMVAAVVGRDGVIWSGVRGVRRAGGEEAATLDHLWHLGSNGKAMTAVLYARLVEQGRAKWGLTLAEAFPGVTIDPALQPVTIDDLLCHRSAIADRDVMTREVVIAAHQDQRPTREQRAAFTTSVLAKAPGGMRGTFGYSNSNYVLAGAMIERLIDRPWEDALKSELFDPLGITSAGHGAPQGEQPWGHRRMGETMGVVDPSRGADNPAAFGPAGRIHMTVNDYAKFLRLYLTQGGGLVQPTTLALLTTPPEGEPPPYAYGWGVRADARLGSTLAHEGSNTMWHAIAQVAPDKGLAVLCIANERSKGGPANQALARSLMALYAA